MVSPVTKRLLLLTDDELTLLVSWGEVAKSASESPVIPREFVAHDWEDEDDELAKKLNERRLK